MAEQKSLLLKKAKAIALAFILVLLPSFAFAVDEIAPGFDECCSQGDSMLQDNFCLEKAIKYWAGKLEKQYAKVLKGCQSAPNPDQCRARLKKMQLGWLNWSNSMADFLKNGLFHERDFISICEIHESLEFEAWATRRQYEDLLKLESD